MSAALKKQYMEDNKKTSAKTRRSFLSLFASDSKATKPGRVKMLTADGKLVEIDQAVLDAAKTNKKASNKEIYEWMQNPSKENNK
jgi:hypothetical protein